MSERVYEIERDRHGLMFSGPLEVGECLRVVPEARAVAAERRVAELEADVERERQRRGFRQPEPPPTGRPRSPLLEAVRRARGDLRGEEIVVSIRALNEVSASLRAVSKETRDAD